MKCILSNKYEWDKGEQPFISLHVDVIVYYGSIYTALSSAASYWMRLSHQQNTHKKKHQK